MESENRHRLKILATGATVVGAGVLGLILLPSLLWAILGGPSQFFDQQVYSSLSPDGSTEVVVFRKVNFPVDGVFDASANITIELRSALSGSVRNSVRFDLHEFGELMEPTLEWTPDTVHISDIDYHKQYEFTFRYNEE